MPNVTPVIEVTGGNALPVTESTAGNATPIFGVSANEQATPVIFVSTNGTPVYIVGGLHVFDVQGVGPVNTLTAMAAAVNANPSANVTMLRNYDATSEGSFSATPITQAYTGVFDGGNFTLSGFVLNDNSNTPGLSDGLFARVGNNSGVGTVKNLTIAGSITQTNWERTTMDSAGRYLLGTTVGGLAAFNSGTIDNCTSQMVVYGSGTGGQYGGLVGRTLQWPDKTITGITQANPGQVTTNVPHGIPSGTQIYIGSVVGMTQVNGAIYTITSTGANTFTLGVDTTGYSAYVSGGVAIGAGVVKNCTTSASVTISPYCSNPYQSPLVASNYGLIDTCVATSSVVCTAPGGYVQSPPTAWYSAGLGGASFTGSIASDGTLTVTATGLGTLAIGQYLYVPNSVPGSIAASGLRITALGTGTGGVGTYITNTPQAISSRDWMAAVNAPGTFPSVGAWMGGMSGDNGLPGTGDSPMAIIRRCASYANLTNSNNTNAGNTSGGISGYHGAGLTEDCATFGATVGANSVGGIDGQQADAGGITRRCISFGIVSSQRDVFGNYGNNLGGLCGQVLSIYTDCETYSNVLGSSATGGAIGLVRGTAVVTRMVAFGTVTGGVNTDGTAGSGFGGLFGQTLSGCLVDQGYCTGVTTGQNRVGACIGVVSAGSTLTNLYWDVDSTGRASGIGQGTSVGVAAVSNASLIAAIPSGFDASWARDANQSSFYPYIITLPFNLLSGGVLPPPTINLNPPLSLSFVGAGTSENSTTVSMPAGIKAGDWCWLFQSSINTSTSIPSLVTPTDFTFLIQATSAATHGTRSATLFRLLDGTETTVTGMLTGTRATFKALMVYRPNNPVTGDVWTRLNARAVANGAGTGVANQTMAAGTSPCFDVAASITDGGTNPTPLISTGDNEFFTITSTITPSLVAKIAYRINNTSTTAVTVNADTTNGVTIACVNVSLS